MAITNGSQRRLSSRGLSRFAGIIRGNQESATSGRFTCHKDERQKEYNIKSVGLQAVERWTYTVRQSGTDPQYQPHFTIFAKSCRRLNVPPLPVLTRLFCPNKGTCYLASKHPPQARLCTAQCGVPGGWVLFLEQERFKQLEPCSYYLRAGSRVSAADTRHINS